jgi:molecular chaperone HscB
MIDFAHNHFELFGLPPLHRIDDSDLERRYRALQRSVHPDRFATAGDADRRLALQASARVNEAYRTLRDPVARAEYLLSLRGVDATAETDTRLSVAFLGRQLERREAAEEASEARDTAALSRLIDEVRREAADRGVDVERLLAADEVEAARARAREWRFLASLGDDLDVLHAAAADR